jgi:acyl carrier protein
MNDNERYLVRDRIIKLLKIEWPGETASLTLDENTPVFYEGIGLDSVDGATLLFALEDEFDIEVEKEALGQAHFKTIGSLTEFILSLEIFK